MQRTSEMDKTYCYRVHFLSLNVVALIKIIYMMYNFRIYIIYVCLVSFCDEICHFLQPENRDKQIRILKSTENGIFRNKNDFFLLIMYVEKCFDRKCNSFYISFVMNSYCLFSFILLFYSIVRKLFRKLKEIYMFNVDFCCALNNGYISAIAMT